MERGKKIGVAAAVEGEDGAAAAAPVVGMPGRKPAGSEKAAQLVESALHPA